MPKLAVVAGAALLALALGPGAQAANAGGAKAPEAPPDDGAAQKRTVADARNTGTAMFSWLTDQVDGEPSEADLEGCPPKVESMAGEEKLVDVVNIPEISWEELRKILVPQYLRELPQYDGWGNPYEFRLNLANPLCPQVMSIRSAGADGRFDTNGLYEVRGYLPDEVGEDVVWSDGFFARWPQKPDPVKEPAKK